MDPTIMTVAIVGAVLFLWNKFKTPTAQQVGGNGGTQQPQIKYYDASGNEYTGTGFSYWFNATDNLWYQGDPNTKDVTPVGTLPPWKSPGGSVDKNPGADINKISQQTASQDAVFKAQGATWKCTRTGQAPTYEIPSINPGMHLVMAQQGWTCTPL